MALSLSRFSADALVVQSTKSRSSAYGGGIHFSRDFSMPVRTVLQRIAGWKVSRTINLELSRMEILPL